MVHDRILGHGEFHAGVHALCVHWLAAGDQVAAHAGLAAGDSRASPHAGVAGQHDRLVVDAIERGVLALVLRDEDGDALAHESASVHHGVAFGNRIVRLTGLAQAVIRLVGELQVHTLVVICFLVLDLVELQLGGADLGGLDVVDDVRVQGEARAASVVVAVLRGDADELNVPRGDLVVQVDVDRECLVVLQAPLLNQLEGIQVLSSVELVR